MSFTRFLFKIYRNIVKYPRKGYYWFKFNYLNFWFINLYQYVNKQIILSGSIPRCYQKTIIRGSGRVRIGEKCSFGYNRGGYYRYGVCEIQPRYTNAIIEFGNNVSINNNFFICAANLITIGDNVLFGHFVSIRDHDAHSVSPNNRDIIGEIGTVNIGDNVWVGNNVIFLKNSYIGKNSIVAAGAVVSGKYPANVIIGGVPAKIIKTIE